MTTFIKKLEFLDTKGYWIDLEDENGTASLFPPAFNPQDLEEDDLIVDIQNETGYLKTDITDKKTYIEAINEIYNIEMQ